MNYCWEIQDSKDIWVFYEVGGSSLSKLLFEMKGEFYNGERVYNIIQLPLFKTFLRHQDTIKQLLRTLLSAVVMFNQHNIVHADLKLDNILVKRMGMFPTEFKIIDFGSTFNFKAPGGVPSATPEYMPPEALVGGV